MLVNHFNQPQLTLLSLAERARALTCQQINSEHTSNPTCWTSGRCMPAHTNKSSQGVWQCATLTPLHVYRHQVSHRKFANHSRIASSPIPNELTKYDVPGFKHIIKREGGKPRYSGGVFSVQSVFSVSGFKAFDVQFGRCAECVVNW